ncbi:MAG: GHKL domain-containing protein [Nitrospirae bacterium]|nr:GHKL domain-containing protein [Nitrospirota bacterium]
MRSLQTRLSTGLIISLLILFSLQWILVSKAIRYLTEDYVASRLQHDTESLLSALIINGDNVKPTIDIGRLDSIYERPFSGHYYQIKVGLHVLRSRSLWDQELSVSSVQAGETLRSHSSGPGGQPLLLLTNGYRKENQPVIIALAEDLSSIESDIRRFQTGYGVVSIAILIIMILIQRLIVGAGLAPLERVRRDITSLEKGEITRLREDVPREMRPLIIEINRLLEIMGQRLQRSRNALGNLAHALKTPLTLLMQLSNRNDMKRCEEVRQQLVEQTGKLSGLMERELKRARLAGTPGPGQQVVLKEEINYILDALKKIYKYKALEFECIIPAQGVISGDREDMLELMGNLLDNACKWARSKVSLRVQCDKGVLIEIEDDGPGCPSEEMERLSNRGVRLDENAAGHGLGLSIVKDIIDQYSGEISFGRSEGLGGFRVFVKLPEGVMFST